MSLARDARRHELRIFATAKNYFSRIPVPRLIRFHVDDLAQTASNVPCRNVFST